MTKAKPPEERRPRGRPKGSGKGLDYKVFFNATASLVEALDAEAEALGVERSVLIRDVLERWIKRRAKP